MKEEEEDKHPDLLSTAIIPGLFILVLLVIKYLSIKFQINFLPGIQPHTAKGLWGILSYPLLHKDMEHLFSNAVPLFLLGMMMVYFYRQLSFKVFVIIYFLSGIGTWLIGRENSIHIGASGIVNGLVTFLFVSGILRKDNRLMALSLLVIFLYGSIVWGMIPLPLDISWEAHLSGGIAGVCCAFLYKNQGPQRKKFDWELEEENEEENENPDSPENNDVYFMPEIESNTDTSNTGHTEGPVIRYIYQEKKEDGDKPSSPEIN